MIRWDRFKHTRIDMDFADSALSVAAEMMKDQQDTPQMAVCAQSATVYAEPCCKKVGVPLFVIPDALMKHDGWVIFGEHSAIWSPGA